MGNWAKQARLAIKQGDYTQAGDFFKLDGDYSAAINAYTKAKNFMAAARLHEELGHVDKARKLLEKDGSPKERADFLLRHGKMEEAIALYLANGMEYEAAEHLERAENLGQAAEIFERLGFSEKAGILYGRAKLYDKAIAVFTKLIKELEKQSGPTIRPKIEKYWDWIANFHLAARRYNQAGAVFEQIMQREKAAKCYLKAENYLRAGRIFLELNQNDQAKLALSRAPSLESRTLLGQISYEEGNYQEAVTLLKGTDNLEFLTKALEQLGQYQEAGEVFERACDLKNAAMMYMKSNDFGRAAMIFEQQGLFQEAAEAHERAQKWGHAAKLYHLARNRFKAGYCLFKCNRPEDALAQLQAMDPAQPDYAEAKPLMAEIFFKMGNFSVARKLLEEITANLPLDDSTITQFYLLALCLESENNQVSALKYYERIMARRIGFADVRERIKRLRETGALAQPHEPTLQTQRDDFKPMDLREGDLIANRFRVIGTIGKGGMGYIFKVRDLSLNRDIALKMLIGERGNLEELKAELVTARDLTHKYIIKVFDIGETHRIGYFTMEHVEGESLKSWIHSHAETSVTDKVRLIIEICEGLNAAHEQGVIHRDIKPQNILIDLQNHPKILDFGIARRASQTKKDNSIAGSPKYMAPEQVTNATIDFRTDIYALGCIMYYMFTLQEPFLAKTAQEIMAMQLSRPLPNPRELVPHLDLGLIEIIQKCCQKNPIMRYGTMPELLDDLRSNLLMMGTDSWQTL